MLRALLILTAAVAIGACGGSPAPAVQRATPQEPDAAAVAEWPAKWCGDVHVGNARADVVATMGTPTESYADQDQWDGFGYHFTAFYDETGTVSQLDINTIQMSDSQKAKVTCDETRS